MEFYNLGNYEVSGTGVNKFNLGIPPEHNKKYLVALLVYANCVGTATEAISKKNFLAETCKQINLYVNNRLIVDNLDGESLDRLNKFYGGMQFPDYTTPSVSGAGTYNKTFLIQIPFAFSSLVDKYDFVKKLDSIKSISLEYKKGNLNGLTSMNLKVVAVVDERENEYISPEIKIRKFTISKQISDTIQVSNRVIAGIMQLPSSGTLDDIVVMRTKRKVLLDNLALSTLNSAYNIPNVFDDLQLSDLNFKYLTLCQSAPISIKKPIFYEGEDLFFDDLSPSNSPFDLIIVEVLPAEQVAGEPVIESRVSPLKINS